VIEWIVVATLACTSVAVLGSGLVRKRRGDRPSVAPAPPTGPASDELSLNDVLLYLDEELWLAGVLELRSEEHTLRFFVCPRGEGRAWVVAPNPAAPPFLLDEGAERTLGAGAVPVELRHSGRIYKRVRVLDATVQCAGTWLPEVQGRVRMSWLEAPGERALCALDFAAGQRIALAGERMAGPLVERLPGTGRDPAPALTQP